MYMPRVKLESVHFRGPRENMSFVYEDQKFWVDTIHIRGLPTNQNWYQVR